MKTNKQTNKKKQQQQYECKENRDSYINEFSMQNEWHKIQTICLQILDLIDKSFARK